MQGRAENGISSVALPFPVASVAQILPFAGGQSPSSSQIPFAFVLLGQKNISTLGESGQVTEVPDLSGESTGDIFSCSLFFFFFFQWDVCLLRSNVVVLQWQYL